MHLKKVFKYAQAPNPLPPPCQLSRFPTPTETVSLTSTRYNKCINAFTNITEPCVFIPPKPHTYLHIMKLTAHFYFLTLEISKQSRLLQMFSFILYLCIKEKKIIKFDKVIMGEGR